MVQQTTNLDNSNKDIKIFVAYLGYSDSMPMINEFLSSTSCEIIHIATTEKYISIFYKETKNG